MFSRDHQILGMYSAADGFVGSTECTVQYTTNPMYRNLSEKITLPPDTHIPLLDSPVPKTTYYFLFTVFVNNTMPLELTERLAFTFSNTQTGRNEVLGHSSRFHSLVSMLLLCDNVLIFFFFPLQILFFLLGQLP